MSGAVSRRGRLALVRVLLAAAALPALQGCGSATAVAGRPAASSYGCMQAAIREQLPAGPGDAARHCIASGLIALRCSPAEAMLAGWGKELADLLGHGDADTGDLRADRRGRDCARRRRTAEGLSECCLGTVPAAGGRDSPNM